jgi:hypothetical protein
MPLMECPQYHVYPNNEEIFIQLKYTKKEQLEKINHKVKLSLDPRDHSLAFLEAFVDQVCVLQIHLALSSAKFLCFLLNHYQDIPLPQLISALKIPKTSDIDKVLSIMEQYQMATVQVKGHCERLIQSILINNITG